MARARAWPSPISASAKSSATISFCSRKSWNMDRPAMDSITTRTTQSRMWVNRLVALMCFNIFCHFRISDQWSSPLLRSTARSTRWKLITRISFWSASWARSHHDARTQSPRQPLSPRPIVQTHLLISQSRIYSENFRVLKIKHLWMKKRFPVVCRQRPQFFQRKFSQLNFPAWKLAAQPHTSTKVLTRSSWIDENSRHS